MFELYMETLLNMGVFVDGIMAVDTEGIVRYCKVLRSELGPIQEKNVIGKGILELYPSLTTETSNVFKALSGIPSINQFVKRFYMTGEVITFLENTLPIKENGTIVGAISTVKYANSMIREVDFSSRPSSSSISEPHDFGFPSFRKSDRYQLSDIIGNSAQIRRLKEQLLHTARTSSPVLIYGQTGTGKEMAAQSIYSESERRGRPFLSQNCAAIPSNLLESLFFGTTKGSYTGAMDKDGIFEQAEGGVIFLDEINSMDLTIQAKLLKVIEEKQVTRIGASHSTRIDVRIIAAMNEPPQTCIQRGKLRSDLFYRLSTVQIELPPLRERPEDIPILTTYFLHKYNIELGRSVHSVSPEAAAILQSHSWPGNVRELKNVLESAFNFTDGNQIERENLPSYLTDSTLRSTISAAASSLPNRNSSSEIEQFHSPAADTNKGNLGSLLREISLRADTETLKSAVEQFEKNYILSKFPYARNLTDLARMLGLTRQALNYKLKKYQIHP